jgi:hypothetical protein
VFTGRAFCCPDQPFPAQQKPAGTDRSTRRDVRSMEPESIQIADREDRARELYRRYGGLPWAQLPERTRDHFRCLVRDKIDGQGRPLDEAV